jgi:hypothetical protein
VSRIRSRTPREHADVVDVVDSRLVDFGLLLDHKRHLALALERVVERLEGSLAADEEGKGCGRKRYEVTDCDRRIDSLRV